MGVLSLFNDAIAILRLGSNSEFTFPSRDTVGRWKHASGTSNCEAVIGERLVSDLLGAQQAVGTKRA
jgi:hypothetical protein